MKNIKRLIIKATLTVGAALLGAVSLVGTASANSITLTGPGSVNVISSTTTTTTVTTNTNLIGLTSLNFQTAVSGSANVSGNTIGGSATTGPASNWSNSWFNLYISN